MGSYFYIDGETQKGPVSLDELLKAITPETEIWTQGMTDWAPAKTIPEISALFPAETRAETETEYAQPVSVQEEKRQSGSPSGVPDFQNLLIWAIISTFLCCNVTGVVGIVMNLKGEVEWAKGNHEKAWEKFRTAKTWTIVGAVLGFIMTIVIFMVQGAVIMNNLGLQ